MAPMMPKSGTIVESDLQTLLPSFRICTPPPFLIFLDRKLNFIMIIKRKYFVYDKNLPSYDFFNHYFFFGTNQPKMGHILTLTETGVNPYRNGS